MSDGIGQSLRSTLQTIANRHPLPDSISTIRLANLVFQVRRKKVDEGKPMVVGLFGDFPESAHFECRTCSHYCHLQA